MSCEGKPRRRGDVLIEESSSREQRLMDEIEAYLSRMEWPRQETLDRKTSKHKHVTGRYNVGAGVREAFVLGKVRKWDDHVRLRNSLQNKKHKDLHSMLRALMRTHNPTFRYNAIQLNKNVETKPHYDKRNTGCSYCLGLGKFRGGGLRVFAEDGTHRDVNNKRRWVLYNGKKTLHASVPVASGTRYALIFYMYALKKRSSQKRSSQKRSSQKRSSGKS